MMTNVDLEGFRDWTDEELKEAMNFIKEELKERRKKNTNEALAKIKEGLMALKAEYGEETELHFDGYYSFDVLYAEIEAEVK